MIPQSPPRWQVVERTQPGESPGGGQPPLTRDLWYRLSSLQIARKLILSKGAKGQQFGGGDILGIELTKVCHMHV